MKHAVIAVLVAVATLLPLAGQAAKHVAAVHAGAQASATAGPLVEAQVKKVSKASGKVTLSHGPIPNLGMGGMTMAFKLKDPAWIDQFKEGDRIRFVADEVKGDLTVMSFELVR